MTYSDPMKIFYALLVSFTLIILFFLLTEIPQKPETLDLELEIQRLEADCSIRDAVIDCLVNSNNALILDLDKWRCEGEDE